MAHNVTVKQALLRLAEIDDTDLFGADHTEYYLLRWARGNARRVIRDIMIAREKNKEAEDG